MRKMRVGGNDSDPHSIAEILFFVKGRRGILRVSIMIFSPHSHKEANRHHRSQKLRGEQGVPHAVKAEEVGDDQDTDRGQDQGTNEGYGC